MKRMLTTASIALGMVTLGSCTVSLDDPAGRACDDAHACAQGRVCKNGVCVSPLASDAAVDGSGASPDGADAGATNLEPNGTFEKGCDPWIGFQGDATPSSVGHSDSSSCRVCSSQQDFTLDDKGFLRPPPRGHYTARAWVRVAPGKPSPTVVGIILRTIDESGGPYEIERNAAEAAIGQNDWGEATVSLDVTKDAEALNVVVYAVQTAGTGACVLVDDVTVVRAP